jgi:hypothetical protein
MIRRTTRARVSCYKAVMNSSARAPARRLSSGLVPGKPGCESGRPRRLRVIRAVNRAGPAPVIRAVNRAGPGA